MKEFEMSVSITEAAVLSGTQARGCSLDTFTPADSLKDSDDTWAFSVSRHH